MNKATKRQIIIQAAKCVEEILETIEKNPKKSKPWVSIVEHHITESIKHHECNQQKIRTTGA